MFFDAGKFPAFRQSKNLSQGMRRGVAKEIPTRQETNSIDNPAEDVITYIESQERKHIIQDIQNVRERQEYVPGPDKLNRMLGFFFIEIGLGNANRAGELRKMTMEEFNQAKTLNGTLTV